VRLLHVFNAPLANRASPKSDTDTLIVNSTRIRVGSSFSPSLLSPRAFRPIRRPGVSRSGSLRAAQVNLAGLGLSKSLSTSSRTASHRIARPPRRAAAACEQLQSRCDSSSRLRVYLFAKKFDRYNLGLERLSCKPIAVASHLPYPCRTGSIAYMQLLEAEPVNSFQPLRFSVQTR
jgi:hypothetical protein